jgi:DNA-binding transcriptional regulator YiaG
MHSSDTHLVVPEEARWKRYLRFLRKPRHGLPEPPRDTVLLPLVDRLTVDSPAESAGERSPATERVNEFRVTLAHDGSFRISFGNVNAQVSGDAKNARRETDGMANERSNYALECGTRLRKTREALGSRVLRRFAENTGVPEDSLQKWEKGGVLVPPWYVARLKDLFGISHDWIYSGDASKMAYDLTTKLLKPDDN